MIEFYDNNMSACAQKVRLVLVAKGLEFERHHLNLRAGDQFDPAYLKLNPKAVVPTIVDDGKAVIESTVIMMYLDDAYPEPSLSPPTALGRADMLRWMIQSDAGLHDACGVTSFALAFRHQLAKLTPEQREAHYRKTPDEKRREHVRSVVEKGLDAPGVPEAFRRYHGAVRDMSKALASSAWLAGDDYSLADMAMLPYVIRLEHLGLDWFWSDHAPVADWLARCKGQPWYAAIDDYLDAGYIELMSKVPADEMQKIRDLL
jgi:glutathione S-transferase